MSSLSLVGNLQILLESNEGFMIRFDTFEDIKKAIMEAFSGTGGYVILYEAGIGAGARACRRYVMEVGVKEPEVLLANFVRRKKRANWGVFSLKGLDAATGIGTIQIRDFFEARSKSTHFKDAKGALCCCPFTLGYVKGFLQEIYAKKLDLKPVKCVLEGSEYCELEVSSPQ